MRRTGGSKERGSMCVNKKKRSVSRELIGAGICIASMFIVILLLPVLHKGGTHVQHPMHYRANKKLHVLKERVVPDMQEIERGFAERQIQYLDALFMVQNQAHGLLNWYHQEIVDWGKTHQYHDQYNKQTYQPDYEYSQAEGSPLDGADVVKSAHTINDYQTAIKLITTNFMHLQAMEADYADKTSWKHSHATDLQLIQYHHLSRRVIVISFIEQACRVYQDGKLVKAFLITSGRFNDPSPVGLWHISRRRWHTIFKSRVPVGSPNWYPDTPINYAMEYRTGGYYLHDSWWRAYYGPGTNFPHYDPYGEEFSGSGSHGCINLSLEDAAWLYANTAYGTTVVTY